MIRFVLRSPEGKYATGGQSYEGHALKAVTCPGLAGAQVYSLRVWRDGCADVEPDPPRGEWACVPVALVESPPVAAVAPAGKPPASPGAWLAEFYGVWCDSDPADSPPRAMFPDPDEARLYADGMASIMDTSEFAVAKVRAWRADARAAASAEPAALAFGEVCRAKCGAPARYLGDGRCLFVSAMCNDLSTDDARPATGGEERFPLPSDAALDRFAAKAEGGAK